MSIFHVEAVVGISDVIQVHFLCVLIAGSLLCGNARHLALLVSGREVVDIGCLLAHSLCCRRSVPCHDPQFLTALQSQRWVVQSRCCCLCLCGAFALIIPWD